MGRNHGWSATLWRMSCSGPAADLSGNVAPITGASSGVGTGVALGLAADRHVLKTSGTVVVAAACGKEYGFTDVDGKQPTPVTVDRV
jgi:hypothetical protein